VKSPNPTWYTKLGLRRTFDSVRGLDLLIGHELDSALGKRGHLCQEQGRASACTAGSCELSRQEQGLCDTTAGAHASACCAVAGGA
jgi:hypothetical protein